MKKILYVEDDPINALVMKKLLGPHFEVVHAADGESCLSYLSGNPIDLILMDINLGRGKMDGIQTLKGIKSIHHQVKVPVFAVTSYAMPEDEKRFLNEGFDAYIAKPIERQNLVERIHKFLS